eukprot:scaffold830_cov377-Prasinococcus_capsulatus_cf.AAC.10
MANTAGYPLPRAPLPRQALVGLRAARHPRRCARPRSSPSLAGSQRLEREYGAGLTKLTSTAFIHERHAASAMTSASRRD